MVKRTYGVPPPPFPPAPPNPFRRAAPTSTARVAPAAVAGQSISHVTEQMRAAGDHAWMTSDGVDSGRVFWAMLAAAPTTQPAPQQEALRLAKYVARRKLAKQLDTNEIHGFDSGCDTEAVLLLSDIEAVLSQVAALTAAQPAAPQQEAQEPLTDSQIMASIGRNAGKPNTSISESRPLGQQWDQVCNLVRDIFRERYAPAPQQEPDEISSYIAARAWVARAAQEGQ